jgi:hypothetical protein
VAGDGRADALITDWRTSQFILQKCDPNRSSRVLRGPESVRNHCSTVMGCDFSCDRVTA